LKLSVLSWEFARLIPKEINPHPVGMPGVSLPAPPAPPPTAADAASYVSYLRIYEAYLAQCAKSTLSAEKRSRIEASNPRFTAAPPDPAAPKTKESKLPSPKVPKVKAEKGQKEPASSKAGGSGPHAPGGTRDPKAPSESKSGPKTTITKKKVASRVKRRLLARKISERFSVRKADMSADALAVWTRMHKTVCQWVGTPSQREVDMALSELKHPETIKPRVLRIFVPENQWVRFKLTDAHWEALQKSVEDRKITFSTGVVIDPKGAPPPPPPKKGKGK